MTDIRPITNREKRRRWLLLAFCLAILLAAVCIGSRLEAYESCIIIPVSPFSGRSFAEGAVALCGADAACFLLLSLSLSGRLMGMLSGLILLWRGMVIGLCHKILLENTVSVNVHILLVSYVAVTLLCLAYHLFMNTGNNKSFMTRGLSCLCVTGAAAVVRIVPMLFI